MLLWKRYVNNKMAAMRFLHLQQYSHRLNLLYVFFFSQVLIQILICINLLLKHRDGVEFKAEPTQSRMAAQRPTTQSTLQ